MPESQYSTCEKNSSGEINPIKPHHLKGKAAQDGCYRPSHEPQHQKLDKDAYYGVIELRAWKKKKRRWAGEDGECSQVWHDNSVFPLQLRIGRDRERTTRRRHDNIWLETNSRRKVKQQTCCKIQVQQQQNKEKRKKSMLAVCLLLQHTTLPRVSTSHSVSLSTSSRPQTEGQAPLVVHAAYCGAQEGVQKTRSRKPKYKQQTRVCCCHRKLQPGSFLGINHL